MDMVYFTSIGLSIILTQDTNGYTSINALCDSVACIGEWTVDLKVVLTSGGNFIGPFTILVKILCQSDSLTVNNPHVQYPEGTEVIPYYAYRLGSGPTQFWVSSIT